MVCEKGSWVLNQDVVEFLAREILALEEKKNPGLGVSVSREVVSGAQEIHRGKG